MDAKITTRGPMFDGSWNSRVDAMVTEVADTEGEYTAQLVHANLNATLKNPTGAYYSRINVVPATTHARVDDQRSVYGPWLERGRTGTRFKGYANWRRAFQEMQSRVTRVADQVVRQHVTRLGG